MPYRQANFLHDAENAQYTDEARMRVFISRLPDKDLLKPPDVALAADVDCAVVRAWIESGELPATNVSGADQVRYQIARLDAIEFYKNRKV